MKEKIVIHIDLKALVIRNLNFVIESLVIRNF
jgi:hypothetical protein